MKKSKLKFVIGDLVLVKKHSVKTDIIADAICAVNDGDITFEQKANLEVALMRNLPLRVSSIERLGFGTTDDWGYTLCLHDETESITGIMDEDDLAPL